MNRAEFMSKVAARLVEKDVRQVEMAYLLAKKFHQGQYRREIGPDGQPLRYVEHPKRVAMILMEEIGVASAKAIMTALCHDLVEDAEETVLVGFLLEKVCGHEVSLAVQFLSKFEPKGGYIWRLERSFEPTHGITGVVKMADRLDNLRSLPKDDPVFSERQRKETRDIYLPLFLQATGYFPAEWLPGASKVCQEIADLSRSV